MNTFRKAIVKLKGESLNAGTDHVKVKMIIENYDSFLEAKKVLDAINSKFADAEQTRD